MNKMLIGGIAVVVIAGFAYLATQKESADKMMDAGSVKVGILLGFTGPIESDA